MHQIVTRLVLVALIALLAACAKPEQHPHPVFLGGNGVMAQTSPHKSTLVQMSLDWESGFPTKQAKDTLSRNQLFIIYWVPSVWGDSSSISPSDILNGDWDDFIEEFIADARRFEFPVFLAPMPFANDESSINAIDKWAGKDVEKWLAVQNYLYNKAQEDGAGNIQFIWSFTVPGNPAQTRLSAKTLLKQLPKSGWIGIQPSSLLGKKLTMHHVKEWEALLSSFPNRSAVLYLPSEILSQTQFRLDEVLDSTLQSVRGVIFTSPLNKANQSVLKTWQESIKFDPEIEQVRSFMSMGDG